MSSFLREVSRSRTELIVYGLATPNHCMHECPLGHSLGIVLVSMQLIFATHLLDREPLFTNQHAPQAWARFPGSVSCSDRADRVSTCNSEPLHPWAAGSTYERYAKGSFTTTNTVVCFLNFDVHLRTHVESEKWLYPLNVTGSEATDLDRTSIIFSPLKFTGWIIRRGGVVKRKFKIFCPFWEFPSVHFKYWKSRLHYSI